MKMNIEKEIEKLLKESLEKLKIDFDGNFNLAHPQDLKFGDWTTNIALQLAGKIGGNPRKFAEQIHASIPKNKNIEKIEIAGPGYLNFYLSKQFFKKYLENFEKDEKEKNTEKILLEHSSPNLFKPFHIGHMVNNSIGEAIHRILSHQYREVIQLSFPSDVSPGIAKTIWSLKKENREVKNLTLQEIADAYVLGTREYNKKSDQVKKEIEEINEEIYSYLNEEKVESQNIQFYKKGKNLSLEHFREITKKLGSVFQEIIFESEAERVGKEIVRKNIGKIFQEVQNDNNTKSVIFEGEKYTNVFINSQGFGTYLAKDIGLLNIKKEKYWAVDTSLVITDVEQKQHFEMVREVGEKISEISDFTKKSKYLQHGRMHFKGNVKISSRYGNVPLALDVIKKVQENILEKMKDREFSDDEKQEISEKLSIANLKYSILKVTSGKNISFDLEKDINSQGDTASFLLYAFVRSKSIFRNIQKNSDNLEFEEKESEISDLEKILIRFEENIQRSAEEFSAHHLAKYLYDLAQKFNSYYAETKFLDKGNPNFNYNLNLLKVFKKTMERGLNLLGIEVVEKM